MVLLAHADQVRGALRAPVHGELDGVAVPHLQAAQQREVLVAAGARRDDPVEVLERLALLLVVRRAEGHARAPLARRRPGAEAVERRPGVAEADQDELRRHVRGVHPDGADVVAARHRRVRKPHLAAQAVARSQVHAEQPSRAENAGADEIGAHASCPSAAFEAGRALLEEGRHPFLRVGGRGAEAEERRLEKLPLGQRHLEPAPDGLHGVPAGDGPVGRDLLRDAERARERLARRKRRG